MGRADPAGTFVEVKATVGAIRLSTSRQQILGHLDAVSRRPAATYFPGAARVFFITTSDTAVNSDVLVEASRLKISIWQAIVCRGNNRLQVGPSTPLNPGVYSPSVPLDGLPGIPGDIVNPTEPAPGLGDPYGGY
jgi:hypothetical protein